MMQHQQLAVAFLRRLDTDEALIGDLLEEYEHRRSGLWFWSEVAVAAAVTLSGRARRPRPHSAKRINLATTPRGSAVGGVGLLALAVFITVVAPQIWWLLAVAFAGGVVLAVVMIAVSHRGGGRSAPRNRNLLLPLVLLIAAASSNTADSAAQLPPAVRQDPIDGIAEAFKSHQVVMLPGGHGSKPFHDLLLAIARDRRLHGVLTDIVVEFGSSRYQDLVDRYMRGDQIPYAVLKQVWQNTTIPGVTNDGPYVEEFYREIRALNGSLPDEHKIRLLLGDPPIDWDHVTSKADVRKWTVIRSTYPADLIRRQVIARGRRALVAYGHLHFPRKEMLTNYDMSDWQAQTMTSWLESVPGTKVFVIMSEGGKEIQQLQPAIASWPALSLARIEGTVIGAVDFALFNGADKDRYAIRGVDDFVKIPREQHRSMRMEDQVDAILWNGNAPPKPILLSRETCADPSYLPMRLGRIRLAGLPEGEAEAVKRACGVHKM